MESLLDTMMASCLSGNADTSRDMNEFELGDPEGIITGSKAEVHSWQHRNSSFIMVANDVH